MIYLQLTDSEYDELVEAHKEGSLLDDMAVAQWLDTKWGTNFLIDSEWLQGLHDGGQDLHYVCFWRIFLWHGYPLLSHDLLYQAIKDKSKLKFKPPEGYQDNFLFDK